VILIKIVKNPFNGGVLFVPVAILAVGVAPARLIDGIVEDLRSDFGQPMRIGIALDHKLHPSVIARTD
jgi:hypothetical protein